MITVQLLSWFAPFALIPLGLVTLVTNTPSCIWIVIHIMNCDKHFVFLLCVTFKFTGATVCTFFSLVFLPSSISLPGHFSSIFTYLGGSANTGHTFFGYTKGPNFSTCQPNCWCYFLPFLLGYVASGLWVFLIAWRRKLKPSNSKAKCSGSPLIAWHEGYCSLTMLDICWTMLTEKN